jgi:hypothetical protein
MSEAKRSDSQHGCVACAQPVRAGRCEFCGVAVAPGGFKVESVLAQSPHGRVYRARDAAGTPVALKELQFAAVPGAREIDAFQREAATLQTLHHPAIPRFIRSFEDGSGAFLRLYLASEFIAGESLGARIAARGRLEEAELRDIAWQILTVLAYLHRQASPVLHRDLKPDNILVRAGGTLALVDFGSARRMEAERMHGSSLTGTFGYIPLEQLGGTVDATSDLYALGATLLHAATGKVPADLFGPGFALRVPDQVPASLRPVIERMVQAKPERRFQTADEVLAALDGAVQPESDPRPPVRRWLLAAAAAAALALVIQLSRGPGGASGNPVAPAPAASAGGTDAKSWFLRAKPSCNPVEVSEFMSRTAPAPGWDGAGYAAGCYALAGKIGPARALLAPMPQDTRWRAAGIVFELAHPVADSGDDVSAAPIMKLVLEFWPNHFQAMYHAGISEYALGNSESARSLLQGFQRLYKADDNFSRNASRALERIARGLPADASFRAPE